MKDGKKTTEFYFSAAVLAVATVALFVGRISPENWTHLAEFLGVGYASARAIPKFAEAWRRQA